MQKICYFLLLVFIPLLSQSGNDKNEKKKERSCIVHVTDVYGESIPGARIIVTELNQAMVADMDGQVRILLPADRTVKLSISVLGYLPVELSSQQLGSFSDLVLKTLN